MRYSFIGECLLCLRNSNLGYCVVAGTKRPPADASLLHIIIIIYTVPLVCALYNTYRYIYIIYIFYTYLYIYYAHTYRSRQDMLKHSSSLCLGEYKYVCIYRYLSVHMTIVMNPICVRAFHLNRIGTKIPFFPFVAIGVRKTRTRRGRHRSGGGNGRLKCKGYNII